MFNIYVSIFIDRVTSTNVIRAMLHITLVSPFCPPKIDVTLKIIIVSKSNSGLS
jgi:hypothetical protein